MTMWGLAEKVGALPHAQRQTSGRLVHFQRWTSTPPGVGTWCGVRLGVWDCPLLLLM